MPGLTLRKNKHVLRASQKSDHKEIYFISQILGSKKQKKSKTKKKK
jgi:hypothetical protein